MRLASRLFPLPVTLVLLAPWAPPRRAAAQAPVGATATVDSHLADGTSFCYVTTSAGAGAFPAAAECAGSTTPWQSFALAAFADVNAPLAAPLADGYATGYRLRTGNTMTWSGGAGPGTAELFTWSTARIGDQLFHSLLGPAPWAAPTIINVAFSLVETGDMTFPRTQNAISSLWGRVYSTFRADLGLDGSCLNGDRHDGRASNSGSASTFALDQSRTVLCRFRLSSLLARPLVLTWELDTELTCYQCWYEDLYRVPGSAGVDFLHSATLPQVRYYDDAGNDWTPFIGVTTAAGATFALPGTAVPEPSSLASVAGGLALLVAGAVARRRAPPWNGGAAPGV